MMDKNTKIYIAGHRGMVGSAILRKFEAEGFSNIIVRTKEELDLTNQADVNNFFENNNPEYVILAAGKVGGIFANNTFRSSQTFDIVSNFIALFIVFIFVWTLDNILVVELKSRLAILT